MIDLKKDNRAPHQPRSGNTGATALGLCVLRAMGILVWELDILVGSAPRFFLLRANMTCPSCEGQSS